MKKCLTKTSIKIMFSGKATHLLYLKNRKGKILLSAPDLQSLAFQADAPPLS